MRASDTGQPGAKISAQEEAARYRILVEAVTDYAIYMLDTGGEVTSWNTGAQRIKGYTPEEIIGQNFARFYTEEDRARGRPAEVLAIAAREGKFEGEGWRVRKDGTRFWAHVVVDPIRNAQGELTGFAKVTRDLTERRQAKEALDRAQEALFQSQKMEAVGQLTGGVAHDFNNLLMAVLGSLELLRKRLPNDAQLLRLLDNAILGARRGATLTQRMLAFARRQELDVRPLDVAKLVQGMGDLLERSLGLDAEIEMRFPDDVQHVIADQNQLELALLNLCVNARDAMKAGGRIRISAQNERVEDGHASGLKAGDYVCLAVADTGEGMDAQTLARATEPFFTTKGVGKGTGLGLSMVHGMAEQMGGRLILKSKPGEGTIAEIWLPGVADEHRNAHGETQAQEPVQAAGGLNVLAVDDDRLVLFNTTAMLEDLGHNVMEAFSGEEALDLLNRHKFDLVITDQAMPRMTGMQLMEAIRDKWPGLPVILVTGYAEIPGDIRVKAPRLGKPFTEKDLARAVAAVRLQTSLSP
ncbi:MAG TPA: PAS domain S-box protein [Rhizomicrobium sp.]|nr:PAS domain S-box protein [Rhizomicrobium sp.]